MIGDIFTKLVDGTCWNNFQHMQEKKQMDIALKVAAVVLGALVFTACTIPLLTPVVMVIGGVGAFGYMTYDYNPAVERAHQAIEQARGFFDNATNDVENLFNGLFDTRRR